MSAFKWIFGGLGFVLGGPIGAIVGAIIGSVFDSDDFVPLLNSGGGTGGQRTQTTEGDIKMSILILIACVMKADGIVKKSEVNTVKPFLRQLYGDEGALHALKMLKNMLASDIDPTAVSAQIRRNVNYSTRLEIVHVLINIANADGEISSSEEYVLETIVSNLGLANRDYISLRALYDQKMDPDWAYKALEIDRTASNEEVKKAYRRMAMKYHPDKVAGAGEEIKKQATEKFRAINDAYEHIKSERGM